MDHIKSGPKEVINNFDSYLDLVKIPDTLCMTTLNGFSLKNKRQQEDNQVCDSRLIICFTSHTIIAVYVKLKKY